MFYPAGIVETYLSSFVKLRERFACNAKEFRNRVKCFPLSIIDCVSVLEIMQTGHSLCWLNAWHRRSLGVKCISELDYLHNKCLRKRSISAVRGNNEEYIFYRMVDEYLACERKLFWEINIYTMKSIKLFSTEWQMQPNYERKLFWEIYTYFPFKI